MAYHQLPFHQRFKQMGDAAEGAFTEIAPLGKSVRLGLNRPAVSLNLMSQFILHTPDFYTSTGWLVEVMGVGADETIKLKETKYEALKQWNKHQRVTLFVWDSSKKRWLLAPLDTIKRVVTRVKRRGGADAFENDGNVFYPIPWDELVREAEVVSTHAET